MTPPFASVDQRSARNRRHIRFTLIGWGTLIGIALSVLSLACHRQDAPPPSPPKIAAQVTGASMAPHLPGAHYRLTCPRCAANFCIDAAQIPREQIATCPNCGADDVTIPVDEVQPGVDVQIQPVTLSQTDSPAELAECLPRWSLTAWHHPLESETATIKRLMGYPGETISIRNGDVFVDGERLRKDWSQQQALAIDVHQGIHELRLRQSLDLMQALRWHADPEWQLIGDTWILNQKSPRPGEPVELTFTHYRTVPTRSPVATPVPVEDNDSFNQATSRNMNSMGDLLWTANVRRNNAEILQVSIHNGERWVVCRLDFRSHQLQVRAEETDLVWERPLPPLSTTASWSLGVSTFDHQITVAIDDEVLIRETLPDAPLANDWKPVNSPIRIEASRSSGLQLTGLYVGRDVFYLDPSGSSQPWPEQPKPFEGFFLLGDNSPVSSDSRHWPNDAITAEMLIGTIEARSDGLTSRFGD